MYISLCHNYISGDWWNNPYKSAFGELWAMEAASIRTIPNIPDNLGSRVCCRKHMRHQSTIHGSCAAGGDDIYGLCADDHFIQRCHDKAGAWQHGSDRCAVDSGKSPRPIHIAAVDNNVHFEWGLVYEDPATHQHWGVLRDISACTIAAWAIDLSPDGLSLSALTPSSWANVVTRQLGRQYKISFQRPPRRFSATGNLISSLPCHF